MLHASDFQVGWPSALRSLALSVRMTADPTDIAPQGDPVPDDGDDAEREPFHLDDTELASRLVRDRGLIHYSTPPRPRHGFPGIVQP